MSDPSISSVKTLLTALFLSLLVGGCAKELPRSVSDFLDDETARDYKLEACNADPSMNRTDEECSNARIAAERLATIREKEKRVQAEESFQRRIEAMRARERDLQRQLDEQKRLAEEQAEYSTAFPVDDPANGEVADPTPTADTNAAPLPVDGG